MSSIIALDIGMKRTGIAKSDALGIAIKPYKTIDTLLLVDEIFDLSQKFEISKIIIGLPHNQGSQETQNFIKEQSKKIQAEFSEIEIIFVNEAYSSREAEARLKERGIKINQGNKELIDMEAAAILLEQAFRDIS
jgi:putative Holliday junction resolvase